MTIFLVEFHSESEETDVFEERSLLMWSDVWDCV